MPAERFVRFVLAHRLWVIALVAVVTAVSVYFALGLTFDSRIEIWFLDDDPALVAYEAFLDRFEADEVAVVGVFAPDVFAPEVLQAVDAITRAAEVEVPHAHRVRSLTNIRIAENVDDFVQIGLLIPELPQSPEQARDIRRRTLGHPILEGTLVNEDGTATAIIVELSGENNDFEGKKQMADALDVILEREARPGVRYRLGGTPPLDRAFLVYAKRDSGVLAPAAFLLVLITTFLVFRRFSAAVVPLSVVLIAVAWLYGLMGALGIQINIVSTSLFALILAVGVADTIHVLSDYYQHLMTGEPPEEAVVHSVAGLLIPCFFTSATTAAGFLSLLASSLAPIREFGWLAALGVTFAFGISVTFVPCVLTLARPPDPDFIERQSRGHVTRCLDWLGRPTLRRTWIVVGGAVVLLGLAFLGIAHLEVGANPMNYFRPNAPIRQDTEAIDRALGGSTSVEFLVETEPEGLKDPETLRKLEAFQRWLETQPGITRTLSVVDSLKDVNRVFRDGSMESFQVPDSRPLAAQLYLLLEGEDDFDTQVQDDYSVARITSRVNFSKSNQLTKRVPVIEQYIAEKLNDEHVRVEPTGFIKLMGDMETYLVESQIRSFIVAFAVITVMMLVLLRSVYLGLYSMIPNLTPVLMGLGFMWVVGVELDPGTVMIGALTLGLVVDDTVHYLVRLRRRLYGGQSLEDSIAGAMRDTGRPIIVTSVVLAAGFSVLSLGSFAPNVNFGLVSALVIVLALLADLVILPSTMLLVKRLLPGSGPPNGGDSR